MADTETSFQRANRLADEAKARKRREYETGPQAWRSVDWSGKDEDSLDDTPDFDAHAYAERPVEIKAFRLLYLQTRTVSPLEADDIREIWHEVRSELTLKETMARQGLRVMWWDEQKRGLTEWPTTRGKVEAVIVPLNQRKDAA